MKLGRNDVCHCGSGKKYKKCCLQNDLALNNEKSSSNEEKTDERLFQNTGDSFAFESELDKLSNDANAFIRNRDHEKALAAITRLLEEFPDQVDGMLRMAELTEAKGEYVSAHKNYEKVIEHMTTNPGFDRETIISYREKLKDLEEKTGKIG